MDRQNWDSTFRSRFERHEQELHGLFLSLYPGDGQAYEPFVEMLHRCYVARPDTMRALADVRSRVRVPIACGERLFTTS